MAKECRIPTSVVEVLLIQDVVPQLFKLKHSQCPKNKPKLEAHYNLMTCLKSLKSSFPQQMSV